MKYKQIVTYRLIEVSRGEEEKAYQKAVVVEKPPENGVGADF